MNVRSWSLPRSLLFVLVGLVGVVGGYADDLEILPGDAYIELREDGSGFDL